MTVVRCVWNWVVRELLCGNALRCFRLCVVFVFVGVLQEKVELLNSHFDEVGGTFIRAGSLLCRLEQEGETCCLLGDWLFEGNLAVGIEDAIRSTDDIILVCVDAEGSAVVVEVLD